MLKNLRTKLKDPFVKEVLLAVVLFCLPFLLWGHVWFSDEVATEFEVFGVVLNHGQSTDAGYIWYAFIVLIPLIYGTLFYLYGTNNLKVLMIVFLIVCTRDFISTTILIYEGSISGYWIVSCILTVILFTILFRYNKLTKPDFTSVDWNKLFFNQKLYLSLFILCLILWFGEFWMPKGRNVINLFLFEIGTFGFDSVSTFLWVFSRKLLPVVIVTTWFLTEVKWWKYALLSPILISIYQIRTLLFNYSDIFDEYEIIQALPLLGLVLIVLLALSKNAQEQYLFQTIYQKTYTRFEQKARSRHRKEEVVLEEAKTKLEALKTNPDKKDLTELLELKRQLEEKLSDKKG